MLVAAVKGYANFAMQSMRLQAKFERELKYKAKTHEEAASEVYFNEQHMMQEYLPGLLISHSLVSVIVDVESAMSEQAGHEISLTDDRAMSQEISPFSDVNSLTAYIELLMSEVA
jgi:hypothetical protein